MPAADRSEIAFVGLGSNLGRPVRQLEAALELLRQMDGVDVTATSGLYRSGPLGGIEQPDFLNMVARVRTSLSPRELLEKLLGIEATMGRDRSSGHWGPRNIDLDLLVYGQCILHEDGLEVPHPGIRERNFVLLPLRDIAPDLVIPGIGCIADSPVPGEPSIERIADGL